jgi:hypothetical protein
MGSGRDLIHVLLLYLLEITEENNLQSYWKLFLLRFWPGALSLHATDPWKCECIKGRHSAEKP